MTSARMNGYGSALAALLLAGCATSPTARKPSGVPEKPAAPAIAHAPHRLYVFVPLSDASLAGSLKLLDKYPKLRLTIAVSPRAPILKDPVLKARLASFLKSRRVELGVQLPNPPIVPLLIDTNSAKDSLPKGSQPPNPPFAFPEDVVQIIARAKAEFFRVWGFLPRGLVLPYGAASPATLALLDHQGFAWTVAALGAPAADGSYQAGSLQVWDAAPTGTATSTKALILDERANRDSTRTLSTLETWAQELDRLGAEAILPLDAGLQVQALPAAWGRRTWLSPDWSVWIGDAPRNTAWQWLRRTREALENYKNSGTASLQRLDMAFEEIYTAENANYFAALGNTEASPAALERLHEFQATLSTVFRLMGQSAPDNLFSDAGTGGAAVPHVSSTTASASVAPDGTEHVVFTDATGDDHGDGTLAEPAEPHNPGAYDLRQFELSASSQTLTWSVTLGAAGSPLIDIYMDLNGQPGLGTTALLPGRGLAAASSDAWEYALTLYSTRATLYRTTGGGTFDLVGTFPLVMEGTTARVVMPRDTIRGSPRRWGYQVLVMARDPASPEASPRPWDPRGAKGAPIYDLLDPLEVPQVQLLLDIQNGLRSSLPFVRVPH